jgi:O-antigen ligase
LLPIPESWWRALPGHAEYITALDLFASAEVSSVRRTVSIVPESTEYGWLALLPPLACLLAVLRLRAEHVSKLLLFMVAFAGLEGLLGLLQVGAGGESIFYFRTGNTYGTAVGTFGNRNHLAGLLAMTLPLIVGLLAFSIRNPHHWRRDTYASAFDANLLSQRALVFASAVMILLCIVFTRSRAGIAAGLVAAGCSTLILTRPRTGVQHPNLLVLGMIGVSAVLAFAIGVAPILERFEPEQLALTTQNRLMIAAATIRAAIEFLPFGSGLSTFPDVFPRFQTGMLAGFVNYAHNDYVQAFMELGFAAVIIVGLLFTAYVARMVELLRREGTRSFTLLQIAAGVALLPTIIHSLFDFALHIPAIAMWLATLAGVMFHSGTERLAVAADRAPTAKSPAAEPAAVAQ